MTCLWSSLVFTSQVIMSMEPWMCPELTGKVSKIALKQQFGVSTSEVRALFVEASVNERLGQKSLCVWGFAPKYTTNANLYAIGLRDSRLCLSGNYVGGPKMASICNWSLRGWVNPSLPKLDCLFSQISDIIAKPFTLQCCPRNWY
jgi:hypothetical protein